MPAKSYIMDDPREAGRLEAKVNSAAWVDQHFKKINDAGIETLEVGCGPGTLLRAIKQKFPNQHVTGIDISHDRLIHSEAKDVIHYVQAGCRELPYSEATFDSVFTRFLLEYLTNREQAVSEMVRVCKPGGKVMLQDLDAQLVTNWPIDNSLNSKIEKIISSLATTGFDPFVGRKLFSMAKAVGLEKINVSVEPYHLIAGTAETDQRQQWQLKLEIAKPLIARALGRKDAANRFVRQYLDYLDDPDTFSYSNLVTIVGSKPSAIV